MSAKLATMRTERQKRIPKQKQNGGALNERQRQQLRESERERESKRATVGHTSESDNVGERVLVHVCVCVYASLCVRVCVCTYVCESLNSALRLGRAAAATQAAFFSYWQNAFDLPF